jgi:hypothetical protein
LGDPNNANVAGPLLGGRREINWDGGGSTATSLAGTPFPGFQDNRGALFTTPGTGFVQAPLDGLVTTFTNPTYSTTFGVFSPMRLFTPIGSNITDVTFFVPGSGGAVQASVSGFGAVFSDVDLPNSSSVQFFGINNNLLLLENVAPAAVSSGGLSFLGAIANAGEQIFRVRITAGNAALGFNTIDGVGGADLVVLDDVLYREPQVVATGSVPDGGSTVVMLAVGLAIMGTIRRTRRWRQLRP